VTTGLGWLDGSAAGAVIPDQLASVLGDTFGESTDGLGSGWYRRGMTFDRGRARVEWDGKGNAAGSVRVEVQQTALDGLGLDGSVTLARSLGEAGWEASRLDCWVDDPERRILPALARQAVLEGQAVTHARPGKWVHDDTTGRATYYLGATGSDRRTRFYDKLEPERTRTELQARRDAARHGMFVIANAPPEQRPSAVLANIVSFVDFREGRKRSDGVRRPRLPWWDAVVGDVAKAAAAPSRPRLSLEERAEWFRQTMSGVLADLYREMGPEWVSDVIREGLARLDDRQEEWAA